MIVPASHPASGRPSVLGKRMCAMSSSGGAPARVVLCGCLARQTAAIFTERSRAVLTRPRRATWCEVGQRDPRRHGSCRDGRAGSPCPTRDGSGTGGCAGSSAGARTGPPDDRAGWWGAVRVDRPGAVRCRGRRGYLEGLCAFQLSHIVAWPGTTVCAALTRGCRGMAEHHRPSRLSVTDYHGEPAVRRGARPVCRIALAGS